MIDIRPVVSTDIPSLHARCWPERSLKEVTSRIQKMITWAHYSRAWAYAAIYDHQVVGYGQLNRWIQRAEISDLIISPDWRGRGIGTCLITELMTQAQKRGFNLVEIGVSTHNKRALALYERLGFVQDRAVTTSINNSADTIIFLRYLLEENN